MKKIIAFLLATVILNSSTIYASETKKTTKPPEVHAIGATLMDGETKRILWEQNSKGALSMASTTKIMTAIYVLENANLDDIVTVSKKATRAPEVKMFLKEGEKIKLKYLMYALMLRSYNDAAVAIAEHVSGTEEEFCKQMTEKAKEIGAKDTVFETPNGLDKGNHHSTAEDMALIASYAMENPEFVKLVNTTNVTVNSDKRTYEISNANKLLRQYKGANGIKTGFTNKAGNCFIGAAKKDGMQLVAVALGSGWGNVGKERKWIDVKNMLNYGFENYEYVTLVTKNKNAGEFDVNNSKIEKVSYYFEEGLRLPLTEEEAKTVEIKIEAPSTKNAPVVINEIVGSAKVYVNGEEYCQIALIADSGAERFDLKTNLEKILNAWLEMGNKEKSNIILPENIFPNKN